MVDELQKLTNALAFRDVSLSGQSRFVLVDHKDYESNNQNRIQNYEVPEKINCHKS